MTLQQDRLLESLRDLFHATGEEECMREIEAQALRLYGVRALVHRDGAGSEVGHLALSARGRLLGHLEVHSASIDSPSPWEAIPQAFTEHAALALDNACMLDEHEHRARRDALTGLRNHREFRETLARSLLAAENDPALAVSLVIIDLDRFKEVNDRGGHSMGDRLLRATAAALSAVCRTRDHAFRIGGDEFALVLSGANREQATRVAVRAELAIAGLAGSSGASWGVAALHEDGSTDERLMAAADAAMYRQKGRARSTPEDPAHTRQRLAVVSSLASQLMTLTDVREIAGAVVGTLHHAFGYYLAAVHRLDDDRVLRVIAGAGPLADRNSSFLAWTQALEEGVNGRVARTGEVALVQDTRSEPDYLTHDPREDPGSELSVPIPVGDRVWGVLNLEQIATHAFNEDDLLLAKSVAAQMGAALLRCALVDELEGTCAATLSTLCEALDTRDAHTASHTSRVGELALAAARSVELDGPALRRLTRCAQLHDIGKIGVRTELLAKPGKLTADEYEEIKQHSAIGADLVERIPPLRDIGPLVRAVHERWDGAGYPDGLRKAEIPIEARIVAVCDAWDAMTSDRPYRAALTPAQAEAELLRSAGSQFDPAVVAAFLESVGVPRPRDHAWARPAVSSSPG